MLAAILSTATTFFSRLRKANSILLSAAPSSDRQDMLVILRHHIVHTFSEVTNLVSSTMINISEAVRQQDIIAMCRIDREIQSKVDNLKDNIDNEIECLASVPEPDGTVHDLLRMLSGAKDVLDGFSRFVELIHFRMAKTSAPFSVVVEDEALSDLKKVSECLNRLSIEEPDTLQSLWMQCEALDYATRQQFLRTSADSYNENNTAGFYLTYLQTLSGIMKGIKHCAKYLAAANHNNFTYIKK